MKLYIIHTGTEVTTKNLIVSQRMATTRDLWFDAKDAGMKDKVSLADVIRMMPTAVAKGIAVFVKVGPDFYRVEAR